MMLNRSTKRIIPLKETLRIPEGARAPISLRITHRSLCIIKDDDVSFKSKSEADNNSSLGETSPADNIQQKNEIVNSSHVK